MGMGSSAPAGASTNMPRAGASVYTPTGQAGADLGYQGALLGIGSSIGSVDPSGNFTLNLGQTPGGQAYQASQEWLGPGSITDYTNPYYQTALNAAAVAAGGAPQLGTIADTLYNTGTWAKDMGYQATNTGVYGLQDALKYGVGTALPQAIANAQGLQGDISSLGGGLQSLFGSTLPQVQGLSSSLLGNAQTGINQMYPQALAGGSSLLGSGQDILSQLFPQALAASNRLYGAGNQALDAAMPYALGGAADLSRYGGDILKTAFDPQGALYDQLQNQVAQQSAAQAAQAGLGGTAYGASVGSNALGNFNINWQNQQLARQAQGLQAAEPAFAEATALPGAAASSADAAFQTAGALPGAVAGSAIAPMQAGAGLPGATLSSFDQPISVGAGLPGGVMQQGGAIGNTIAGLSQAAGALPGNIAGQYGNLASQASQLGFAPISQYAGLMQGLPGFYQSGATLGGLPYGVGSTGTSNALQALGSGVNLGNQQYTIPQQLMQDLQSYLGLGQAASGLSGTLGQMGLNQTMQSMMGLGGALGAGSNLLFGNSLGGGSGLLGNPFSSASSSGLLGGALGNPFSAASGGLLGGLFADAGGATGLGGIAGGLTGTADLPAAFAIAPFAL